MSPNPETLWWVWFTWWLGYRYSKRFMPWNEERADEQVRLHDRLFHYLEPVWDYSKAIGSVSYLSALWCLVHVSEMPGAEVSLAALTLLLCLRMLCLYLAPLAPPVEVQPLRDPVVEAVLSGAGRARDGVLLADLMFSGHTASLYFLAYLVPSQYAALAVCTAVVGVLLLYHRAHYAIDVVVAVMAVSFCWDHVGLWSRLCTCLPWSVRAPLSLYLTWYHTW